MYLYDRGYAVGITGRGWGWDVFPRLWPGAGWLTIGDSGMVARDFFEADGGGAHPDFTRFRLKIPYPGLRCAQTRRY